jgi:hypothetical protein
VPSRKGAREPQPCPDDIYRHRNLSEHCRTHQKARQAVGAGYDKTATPYAAGVAIAATLDWFRSGR